MNVWTLVIQVRLGPTIDTLTSISTHMRWGFLKLVDATFAIEQTACFIIALKWATRKVKYTLS